MDIDRKHWPENGEWERVQSHFEGRMLLWNDCSKKIQPETSAAVARLGGEGLEVCYQIALYLITYLNGISFNTGIVRLHLWDLYARLQGKLVKSTMLFNILLIGALASRGFVERVWFVEKLAEFDIRYMDEVWDLLSNFTDTWGMRISLIKDIWEEVLEKRAVGGGCTVVRRHEGCRR